MKAITVLALLASAAALAETPTPAPSRDELAAVERSIYNKLAKFHVEAPADILGLPRGIYLDGYGAVFTAELGTLLTPGMGPFRPAIGKDEIAQIRAAKEKRMPEVRTLMQQMLVDAAATLDRVPSNENIVIGFVFFYNKWEDRGKMPKMITMRAGKAALIEAAAGRATPQTLTQAIQVREE